MNFKERFLQFILLMITLGNGFATIDLIGDFKVGEALVSGLLAGLGGYGYYYFRQKAMRRLMQKRERHVLKFLDDSEGRFSIGKLALKLNYSVDEVEQIVDRLVGKGVLEVDTNQGGSVVYYLPQTSTSPLVDY